MVSRLTLIGIALVAAAPLSADTLVVFDTSASMEGENLDIAKAECRDLIRSIRIDANDPFVLIPFDSVAQPAIECTTDEAALAAIERLQVTGNTSIAAGLNAASDLIARIGDEAALVVLITDGVDSDTAGRERAERRLGELLQARDANNIPTRMIVKRWGGETATIVSNLQTYSTQVHDVGSATIETLLWLPEVTVLRNERRPNNTGQVVELEIRLPSDGFAKPRDVLVNCQAPASLSNLSSLRPGETKIAQVDLPISQVDLQRGSQDVVLDFQVVGTETILNSVSTTVPIPAVRPIGVLDATLVSARLDRWASPGSGHVVGIAEFEVAIVAADPSTAGLPVRFEVLPSRSMAVLDPDVGTTRGQVGDTVPVKVEFEASADLTDVFVSITGFDEAGDGALELGRKKIEIRDLELPPAERTPVHFTVKRVDPPVWTDLRERRVQTRVWIDVVVDGYIPGKNTVVCAGPGTVRWEPNTLTTGRQEVSLLVETTAPIDGSEKDLPFFFTVQAEGNGAIVLEVPSEPLVATMPPASRVQLVLLDSDGRPMHSAKVSASEGLASVTFRPVLVGRLTKQAAENAGAVQIQTRDRTVETGLEPVTLSMRASVSPSFLFERTEAVPIRVSVPALGPVVEPSSLNVSMTRPAVLSTWAGRYGLWVGGFLIGVVFLAALLWVLRPDRESPFSNKISAEEDDSQTSDLEAATP